MIRSRGTVAAAAVAAVVVALTGSLAAPTAAHAGPTASPSTAPRLDVPTPTAPAPTSTAGSPDAPDPTPPEGGVGPGGRVPGGRALLTRGVVAPAAPPLPAGVTAQGWVLVDLDAGTVLAGRDPHGRYQPASILKTLTAHVLLPRLPGGRLVPVSDRAADAEGSAVGLAPGGTYTADILFTAMMLMSGNDATEALTEAAGGDAAVVGAMGEAARGLGAYDTVVQTPTGLDGWSQLTSAYDMALVLRAAVADPRLLGYDQTERADLPAQPVPKNGQPVGPIEMDNQSEDFLGGYPGALLAKTGFTDAARHTFLCAARRGGHTLGVVMLRAERTPTDQWQQAASLLDWGFDRPAATRPVGTLDTPAALARPSAAPGSAAGSAARSAAPSGASSAPTSTPAPSAGATHAGTVRAVAAASGRRVPSAAAPVAYVGVAALLLAGFATVEGRQRRRRRRR